MSVDRVTGEGATGSSLSPESSGSAASRRTPTYPGGERFVVEAEREILDQGQSSGAVATELVVTISRRRVIVAEPETKE